MNAKKMHVTYIYRNQPTGPAATHNFEGNCGYNLEATEELARFWDDQQILLIPRICIVNVHISDK